MILANRETLINETKSMDEQAANNRNEVSLSAFGKLYKLTFMVMTSDWA